MPKVDGLTEKMKDFCREYMRNGGNGTQAYLHAYNTTNEVTASREAYELLKREDILTYIRTLNIPLETKAISEREKKRAILWEGIERCRAKEDETGVARYMDILNKMDSEYININRNIEDKSIPLDDLDADTLRKLAEDTKTE